MKSTKKGQTRTYNTRKKYASAGEMEQQLTKRGYQVSAFYGPLSGPIPKGTHIAVLKN